MKPALLLLLLAATFASAQDKAVPVEKEPDHHLAFHNAYTNAFEVEVPPRATTLLHHHAYDYVFVSIGSADIENVVEGKAPVDLKLHDGEVEFARGGFSHRAANKLDTPFRNVTIEILKPHSSTTASSERALEVGMGGLSDPVVDNDDVRVYDVQLAPGGMLHEQKYAHPMLLVAVSDLDIHQTGLHATSTATTGPHATSRAPAGANAPSTNGVNAPSHSSSKTIKQKPGGLEWLPAGTYGFMNMGHAQQRFILVEYK